MRPSSLPVIVYLLLAIIIGYVVGIYLAFS